MAIVTMRHLRLIGLQAEREEMLRRLQHLGCLEITEPEPASDDPLLEKLRIPEAAELQRIREQYTAAEQALQTLTDHTPKEKNALEPLPFIDEQALTDESQLADGKSAAKRLNRCREELASLQSRSEKLAAEEAQLLPWESLTMPLECATTEKVLIQMGTLPAVVPPEQIREALEAAGDLYEFREVSVDRERRYAVLTVHISQAEDHVAAVKALGWSRVAPGDRRGTAGENLAALRREQAELAERKAALEQEIAKCADQKPELRQLSDASRIEMDRGEAKGRTRETAETFLLEGWFPAENTKELEMLLEGCTCAWQMTDPVPEDYPRVPVKLKNNRFTGPLNMVTEMYSLPAYGSLDPNPYMAPFFILFYGIMMADMGYGLLMMAASLLVLKKKQPTGGNRNFFALLGLCGISTFILGAMTGGFFGDFIPQLVKLFNPESTFTWFWQPLFSPINDIIMVMLGSLALGCVQILVGMVIGFIYKLRHGEIAEALCEEAAWWVIIGCGVALGVTGNKVFLWVLLAVLVISQSYGKKGIGGKIVGIGGSIYNHITGYFGDILSYVRLMALMLAGAVIAQVFNTLAAIPGNLIIFFVISILGNALNFALNLLGCYVHDMRLQCLEFFKYFYRDGGRAFRPVAAEPKYYRIAEQ
mgnify:CR=1 FL=1